MKVTCLFVSALTVVSLFSVTQSSAQNNLFDDLTDSRRTGFFVGGGVEYGYTRFFASGPDAYSVDEEFVAAITGLSGGLRGKLGYAISEHTAFYVTSFGTNLAPALGVMRFSQEHPRYYFNGVIGFRNRAEFTGESTDADIESRLNRWNLGLGLGYEFRPHFMLECMLGFGQVSLSEIDYWGSHWNRVFDLSKIEIVTSFNYLFY